MQEKPKKLLANEVFMKFTYTKEKAEDLKQQLGTGGGSLTPSDREKLDNLDEISVATDISTFLNSFNGTIVPIYVV